MLTEKSTSQTDPLESSYVRLARHKTGNKRSRNAWLVVLLIALIFTVENARNWAFGDDKDQSSTKKVVTEQILVVDRLGHKRIEISDGFIKLFDPRGVCRASLDADEESVQLNLWKNGNEKLVRLWSSYSGQVRLTLGNPDEEGITISAGDLRLWRKGIRRIEMFSDRDYSRLVIRDSFDKDRALLGLLEPDNMEKLPSLRFKDQKGVERVLLGGDVPTAEEEKEGTQNGAYLILHDSQKRPIWWALEASGESDGFYRMR